ncbi:MAG: aminoacyl-tRNA hydrolase [Nanoarchaeota archaeon]
MSDIKMVIVIRGDLKNTKKEKVRTGKIIAQACHSVLGFVWNNMKGRKISFELTDEQFKWVQEGQTKIALKANSEKEMMEIFQNAKSQGLAAELITDAGHTEFDGPTKTCIAIGPDYSSKIDNVTGHLSLY